MKWDSKIKRHPTARTLVTYAESLMDQASMVSAAIAAHVNACSTCNNEVKSICASLEFVAAAQPLDPSDTLTARILLDARSELRMRDRLPRRRSLMAVVAKGLTAAAVVVFVAHLYFGAVPIDPNGAPRFSQGASLQHQAAIVTTPSLDGILKIATEIRTLSNALQFGVHTPLTPIEQEQQRAVNAMDTNINAAMDALERNPGCLRAAQIFLANLQKQAEALRNMYAGRGM